MASMFDPFAVVTLLSVNVESTDAPPSRETMPPLLRITGAAALMRVGSSDGFRPVWSTVRLPVTTLIAEVLVESSDPLSFRVSPPPRIVVVPL